MQTQAEKLSRARNKYLATAYKYFFSALYSFFLPLRLRVEGGVGLKVVDNVRPSCY